MTHRRSSGYRSVGVLLLVWTLASALDLRALDETRSKVYGKEVVVAVHEFVRFRNTCIFFNVSLTAGDFFDGLHRINTPTGAHFRKRERTIDYFPDQILVEIRADVSICDTPEIVVLPVAIEFMRSLRFEAKWKRESELRPIEDPSIERSQLPFGEMTRSVWLYKLTIQSKEVPLGDHLVITLITKGGERLARFSARL